MDFKRVHDERLGAGSALKGWLIMSQVPTVELFKGDKRIIANESDAAKFELDGWGKEVAKPAPKPAPAKAEKIKK
jgi:hypothetical protein